MRGELVGETPDLPAAHRVGLPRQGQRTHPGLADAPGGEMAIEDRGDLVRPLRGLVDALAVERDHALRRRVAAEKALDVVRREPRAQRRRGDVGRDGAGTGQRGLEALRVRGDIGVIEVAVIGEIDEEAAEQSRVLPRRDR